MQRCSSCGGSGQCVVDRQFDFPTYALCHCPAGARRAASEQIKSAPRSATRPERMPGNGALATALVSTTETT